MAPAGAWNSLPNSMFKLCLIILKSPKLSGQFSKPNCYIRLKWSKKGIVSHMREISEYQT